MSNIKRVHVGPKFLNFINIQLNTLRGYDLLALELLQNADDARATEIVFNICDDALIVSNDSKFSSCSDRTNTDPCAGIKGDTKKVCNWHAFIDIASGNKENLEEELIGRFGLGFTSVYQITDRPILTCDGTRLTIFPEDQSGEFESVENVPGTEFRLPWAFDATSPVRKRLSNTEVLTSEDIEKVITAICRGTEQALLFIKNVKKISILRDSSIIQTIEIEDLKTNEKKIVIGPGRKEQRWFVASAEASYELGKLIETYPRQIGKSTRRKRIEIAIPISNVEINGGLLFAFLPTQKNTGINVHINADFFPEPSRKDINFNDSSNSDPQAIWNSTLITLAAKLIASNSEIILSLLGPTKFWEIVRASRNIFIRANENNALVPKCYTSFWHEFENYLPDSNVVPCGESPISYRKINDSVIPDGENIKLKRKVMIDIGLNPVSSGMNSYHEILEDLGVEKLGLEKLVNALEKCNWVRTNPIGKKLSDKDIEEQLVPLWTLINDCIPKEINGLIVPQLVIRLSRLGILSTEANESVSIADSVLVPNGIDLSNFIELFPQSKILKSDMKRYPRIADVCNNVDLKYLLNRLEMLILGSTPETLSLVCSGIYRVLSEATHNKTIGEEELDRLTKLVIWPATNGSWISRNQGKVLGSFKDPLGRANIFDLEKLSKEGRNLLEGETKLNAEKLSVKNYIIELLPRVFSSDVNDIEIEKYRSLLIELSNNLPVFDDESVVRVFEKVNFMPSIDGNFREAKSVVFPATKIMQILGVEFTSWIDMRFVPENKRVRELLERLGVLSLPSPMQIVQVLRSVTDRRITLDGQKQVIGILEVILEQRDKWDHEELKNALKLIKDKHILPAKGDDTSWHIPNHLYSPEYATIFSTQTTALVANVDPRNRELMKFMCDELGLKSEPEAKLVVRHLIKCQEAKLKVDVRAYAFLNRLVKRSVDRDLQETLQNLRSVPIYQFGEDKFVKPCDLYFENPRIPSPWAFQVGKDLLQYEDLLKLTGVKTSPGSEDFLRILREISILNLMNLTPDDDKAVKEVYVQCWKNLDLHYQNEQISQVITESLSSEALILTKSNEFKSVDEVLIQDSDWFSDRFQNNFDDYLVQFESFFMKILQGLGVGQVSKNIVSSRGEILGEVTPNYEAQKILHDRRESISAILSGLDENFNRDSIWRAVQVYSVEEVKSHWKLLTGVGPSRVFTLNLSVFLEIAKSELYITRDQFLEENNFVWTPIIRDMLHQLLPAIPENNIRNAISTFDVILSKPPQEAKNYLLQIGYKFLENEKHKDTESVSSEVLSTLGDGAIDVSDQDVEFSDTIGNADSKNDYSEIEEKEELRTVEPKKKDYSQDQTGQDEEEKLGSVSRNPSRSRNNEDQNEPRRAPSSFSDNTNEDFGRSKHLNGKVPEPRFNVADPPSRDFIPGQTSSHENSNYRPRDPQEQREVSNAFIYVLNSDETVKDPDRHKRALRNETISRDFVLKHEASEGRIAEAMSQTNSGYDIESIENNGTGDLRFIEVKSLSGYWGAEGVSLSIKQLEWAYKKGNAYWIYIVENVNSEAIRLFKIQDPAKHIRAFKFNHAWKQIAEQKESKNLPERIYDDSVGEEDVGIDIWHSTLGKCFLSEWNPMGEVIRVKLLFEGDDLPREFPYNPRTMKKINE
jgi:hypothetical protein